jgi:hypothetical protein
VLIKLNKKTLQQFIPLSEAELQGLLHPAEASLGYFVAWFQCLQLPSTQSESPLAPKSHVFLKYVLNCEQNFSFFIFRSGLTVTGLARVYCIQCCHCDVEEQRRIRGSVECNVALVGFVNEQMGSAGNKI